MRKSLVIFVCVAAPATALLVTALTGNLNDRIAYLILGSLGALLIVLRRSFVAWAHSVAETSRIHSHWLNLRPFGVVLFGIGVIILAAIGIFEASQNV